MSSWVRPIARVCLESTSAGKSETHQNMLPRFAEFSAADVLARIEHEAERYFVGALEDDEEKPCMVMVRRGRGVFRPFADIAPLNAPLSPWRQARPRLLLDLRRCCTCC